MMNCIGWTENTLSSGLCNNNNLEKPGRLGWLFILDRTNNTLLKSLLSSDIKGFPFLNSQTQEELKFWDVKEHEHNLPCKTQLTLQEENQLCNH